MVSLEYTPPRIEQMFLFFGLYTAYYHFEIPCADNVHEREKKAAFFPVRHYVLYIGLVQLDHRILRHLLQESERGISVLESADCEPDAQFAQFSYDRHRVLGRLERELILKVEFEVPGLDPRFLQGGLYGADKA